MAAKIRDLVRAHYEARSLSPATLERLQLLAAIEPSVSPPSTRSRTRLVSVTRSTRRSATIRFEAFRRPRSRSAVRACVCGRRPTCSSGSRARRAEARRVRSRSDAENEDPLELSGEDRGSR